MNKRGVGILIKRNTPFAVLDQRRDTEENILVLRVQHTGTNAIFYVGCIYGPNKHEPRFFESLRRLLHDAGTAPVLLGGDWNCTVSCENARHNPDNVNMHNPPNKRHSELLKSLCDDLDLADPYRVKFPKRIEYTFVPPSVLKKNRSRIDFFIISKNITPAVSNISIANCLQNKLFDHRAVLLDFNTKKPVLTPPTVSKKILKDPEIDLVVGIAVAETYLRYSTALTNEETDDWVEGLGIAVSNLREAGPSDLFAVPGDRTEIEELTREGKLGSVREYLEFFPFRLLRDGPLSIDDDMFLECLINNIRNDTISYQQFIKKNTKKKKTTFLEHLNDFKKICRLDPMKF